MNYTLITDGFMKTGTVARSLYTLVNDSIKFDDDYLCAAAGLRTEEPDEEIPGNGTAGDFNLYPNPNAGTFIIISTGRLFEGSLYIQVYDVLGRLVYSKQPRSYTNECITDISYLNNGVYRLIVTESKQQIFSSSIMIIK